MKSKGIGHAHGKVILIGEHAVVYGHPGIALPFKNGKVSVTITASDQDELSTHFYQGLLANVPQPLMFIWLLIEELRKSLLFGPVLIHLDFQLPTSAGLGSSAAINSAIVQAIYDFVEVALTAEIRFEKTQFAEKIVHGASSGIDALTTSHDHAWYFIKNKPPTPLPIHLPGWLLIANTGIKGSTKEAVAKVAKLFTQNLAQGHLESIGLMSLLMKEAIEKSELDDMARLMNQAHYHLQELGVSHPMLDQWVSMALAQGALGAKLTGGGLGGSIIALFDQPLLAEQALKYFSTHLTKESWLMPLQ
jgi:mevalonate kinase